MGTYKSKGIVDDIREKPDIIEEPNYEVKTRSPRPTIWKMNILRGRKEDILM